MKAASAAAAEVVVVVVVVVAALVMIPRTQRMKMVQFLTKTLWLTLPLTP